MDGLLLNLLLPTVGKSNCKLTFSEMYFYDLEKPGIFGIPNQIIWSLRLASCNTYYAGNTVHWYRAQDWLISLVFFNHYGPLLV